MTPDILFHRPTVVRRRQPRVSLFVPVLLLFVALAVIVATLPISGVHIPGQRHLQAWLEKAPLPWKPPRPVYVAAPDRSDASLPTLPSSAQPLAETASNTSASAAPLPTVAGVVQAAQSISQAQPAATVGASPAAQQTALQPAPAVTFNQPPPSLRLDGFRHQWQTWNNCGPATITMALSHFGRTETQAQAAPFLKPNSNDKNVSPNELVGYVESVGFKADYRVAGDLTRLKTLLANDVPVVVEMWFTPHPNDGMGHYRLLVGYDDAAGRFYAYDSYDPPGMNVPLPYQTFDNDWRVFNRTYVPVYPPDKAPVVSAILGAERDDAQMLSHALDTAVAEASARPNDAFAWFNVGSTLTALGRTAEAVPAFDRARSLNLPWRMLWYQFAPFEAYVAEGRYNDVLSLTAANLQQANDLEESHFYRGRALEAMGQAAAARAEYQAALRLNAKYTPAYYWLSTVS